MPPWNVQLLDAAAEELGELPDDMQARFLRIGELLETCGPFEVGRPHVAPLGKGLWEMRIRGAGGIARALFEIRTGRRLAVGRIFVKKTRKVPAREIRLAVQRLKEKEADDG
jgi:phage-related protein